MKYFQFLVVCLAVMIASAASSANADLIVSGTETAPGLYSFSFSQGAGPADPIQNKSIVPLNFKINIAGAVPGSYGGSMTDGSTTLSPALAGWTDLTTTALMFDPNLVTSANSGPLTLMANPGIDFSATNVDWLFGSLELTTGFVQQGAAVPEPSSLAIFGLGLALMAGRRRQKKTA